MRISALVNPEVTSPGRGPGRPPGGRGGRLVGPVRRPARRSLESAAFARCSPSGAGAAASASGAAWRFGGHARRPGFRSSRRPAGGTSVTSPAAGRSPTRVRRVEPGLRPEAEHDLLALPVHGLDAQAVGHHADAAVVGQVQDRRRNRAVAVADFRDDRGRSPLRSVPTRSGDRPSAAGSCRGCSVSSILRSTRRFTVARTSSSISSPLSSRTVSSSSFMYISKPTESMWPLCSPPRRLPAPRISRSSAATRKPLPRSLNSRIAASRFFATGRQRVLGRDQQEGVRRPVGSADAAAQLIELRQAVAIGAIDDDGVRVRDVEPVFDDGRGDEHVVLVRHEVEHRLFELLFAHLAVADDQLGLRHQTRDQVGKRVDRLHAVVDDVDLAARARARGARRGGSLRSRTSRRGSGSTGDPSAASRWSTCRGCRPATCSACAESASPSSSGRPPACAAA